MLMKRKKKKSEFIDTPSHCGGSVADRDLIYKKKFGPGFQNMYPYDFIYRIGIPTKLRVGFESNFHLNMHPYRAHRS